MPPWQGLAESPHPVKRCQSTQPHFGWQQRASRKFLREEVWAGFSDSSRALLRSQHGPLISASLIALPTSRATWVDAHSVSVCADACTCPSLSIHAYLPMWPPTLHILPSSCSVLRGKGVGEKGLPIGGRCGPSVQKGWSSSFHQPPRPGHGLVLECSLDLISSARLLYFVAGPPPSECDRLRPISTSANFYIKKNWKGGNPKVGAEGALATTFAPS